MGLRSCLISSDLNALFQRCIHVSPDPSSTSVETDEDEEVEEESDGTEEVESVEERRPVPSQGH